MDAGVTKGHAVGWQLPWAEGFESF